MAYIPNLGGNSNNGISGVGSSVSNPVSGVGASVSNPTPGLGNPISGVGAAVSGFNWGTGKSVPGTSTSWHIVVLWFLGAMALLALASPAPNVATMIVVILIVGTLLNNWSTYRSYLGI